MTRKGSVSFVSNISCIETSPPCGGSIFYHPRQLHRTASARPCLQLSAPDNTEAARATVRLQINRKITGMDEIRNRAPVITLPPR